MRCLISLCLTVLVFVGQPAYGQDWQIRLTQEAGQVKATAVAPFSATEINQASSPTTLTIQCGAGIDCEDVTVEIVAGAAKIPLTATSSSSKEWSFTGTGQAALHRVIPAGSDAAAMLVVSHPSGAEDPREVGRFPVARTEEADAGGTDGSDSSSLFDLVTSPCRDRLAAEIETLPAYDRKHNLAVVLLSPTGQLLSGDLSQFDEDDELHVLMLARTGLHGRLKVYRKSAIRTLGNLNIVGAGEPPPTIAQAAREPRCEVRQHVIRDFASGRGEVEISVLNEDLTSQAVGNLEISVHPLYDGAFIFGGVRTPLLNPKFTLTPDSLITIAEDGAAADHRILLAVFYTPFIWGRRDLEKPRDLLDHRALNPTIGLVLNDVSEHFLAGVSYDVISSVYLAAGAHFGRVRALDPNATNTATSAPYRVGDKFTGAADAIPTVTNWETDFFVAVGLDLRAAVQLLKKVVGGAASP